MNTFFICLALYLAAGAAYAWWTYPFRDYTSRGDMIFDCTMITFLWPIDVLLYALLND